MLYLALPHRPPTPTGGALLALGIRERHRCGQRGRRAKQLAHLACVRGETRRNQRVWDGALGSAPGLHGGSQGCSSALKPSGPPCASGRAPRASGGPLCRCRDEAFERAASAVFESVHGEGPRVSTGHVALRDLQRVGVGGEHDALALALLLEREHELADARANLPRQRASGRDGRREQQRARSG